MTEKCFFSPEEWQHALCEDRICPWVDCPRHEDFSDETTDPLEPIGRLTNSGGSGAPYFNVRYNRKTALMSEKPLGWQALILFLGEFMWINIDKKWLD